MDCSKSSYETDGLSYYLSKCYLNKEKPKEISPEITITTTECFKDKLQNQKLEHDRKAYQKKIKITEKELSQSKHSEEKIRIEAEKRAMNGENSFYLRQLDSSSCYHYEKICKNPDTKKEESLICHPLKKYFNLMKESYSDDIADCLKYTEKKEFGSIGYCFIEVDWSK